MIWASIGMFAVLCVVFLAGMIAGDRLSNQEISITLLRKVVDETLDWYDFDGSIRAAEEDDFEVDYDYILGEAYRKIN